jgi:hypothetical protein
MAAALAEKSADRALSFVSRTGMAFFLSDGLGVQTGAMAMTGA